MRKKPKTQARLAKGQPVLFGMVATKRRDKVSLGSDGKQHIKRGPAAYFIDTKLFTHFIKEMAGITTNYKAYVQAWTKENKRLAKSLNTKVERLVSTFNRDFGFIFDYLVTEVHFSNGEIIPYVNPLYFPRSGKERKLLWELIDTVHALYGLERGDVSGRTPGGSKYHPADIQRYEYFRKKQKKRTVRNVDYVFADGSYDYSKALSTRSPLERTFKKEFDCDGEPEARLKTALSRLRKKKPAPLKEFAQSFATVLRSPPYQRMTLEGLEDPPFIKLNNLRNS